MFTWYISGRAVPYEQPRTTATRRTAPTPEVDDALSKPQHSPHYRPPEQQRRPALTVTQIMTTPVVSLPMSALLSSASQLFKSRRFRHVPITNERGVLVGIFSDRDLLRELANIAMIPIQTAVPAKEMVDPNAESTILVPFRETSTLGEVMVTRVLTALPSTEIREIARVMFTERIGSMPVLDSSGKLVGMVTRSDILRTVMNHVPLELWV